MVVTAMLVIKSQYRPSRNVAPLFTHDSIYSSRTTHATPQCQHWRCLTLPYFWWDNDTISIMPVSIANGSLYS